MGDHVYPKLSANLALEFVSAFLFYFIYFILILALLVFRQFFVGCVDLAHCIWDQIIRTRIDVNT